MGFGLRKYFWLFLLLALRLGAQQPFPVTPNLGLNLPPQGYPNWGNLLNDNFMTLDTVTGGLQRPWQGAWSPTVTYTLGQMVSWHGFSYVSQVNNNLNNQPDISPTQWSPFGTLIPGLGSDGNNGVTIAGGVQIGPHEYVVTCNNTNADAIAINNAFTAGGPGTVVKLSGGQCADTTQTITMQSYDTLDGQGSTALTFSPLQAPIPATQGMLTNAAAQAAPNRTFTDAVTTANSYTLTSATANFTAADTAQTIMCNGVLGSGTTAGVALPNVYWTAIRYVTSATSVQLVDPVPLSTTATTCSIWTRDSHLTLKGLKIINNGPACSTAVGSAWWIPVFWNVNGLSLEDLTFQDGTTGTSTTSGCKSILMAASSNIRVHNVGFATWQQQQDGFDFFGDVSDVMLDQIHGFTGDNTVSIASSENGFAPGFPQGPVHNVTLANSAFGTGRGAVALVGATGVSLPVTGVTIRDLRCRETFPPQPQIGIGYGLYVFEGSFDTLLIDGMSGYCQRIVYSLANVSHLTVRNVSTDVPIASATTLLTFTHSTANPNPAYGDVVVDGLTFVGALPANGNLINMDGTQTFNTLTISNASLLNYSSTVSPFYLNAVSIGTLNFVNDVWQLASGSGVPVNIGPANGSTATMALGTLNIAHITYTVPLTGGGGSYAFYLLQNMSNAVNVNVTNSSMMGTGAGTATTSTGYMIRARNTSPPPNFIPSLSFVNSAFINVSGCFVTAYNSTTSGVGANISGAGLVTSGLASPGSCPASGQLSNPVLYGYNTYGPAGHYDNVTFSALPNLAAIPGHTTTTTGGTLLDNTTYYYKLCATNGVGYSCSPEHAAATGNSGSNTNTITLNTATPTSPAATYTLARSTTSQAEQACTGSGYANILPVNIYAGITDFGAVCNGATVPATNTTLPIQTGLLKGNGPVPVLTYGTGAGTTNPTGQSSTGNQHSFNASFTTTATPAASAALFTMPISLPDSGCPTNIEFSGLTAASAVLANGDLFWTCAGSTITVSVGTTAFAATTAYKLGVTLVY